MNVEPDPTVCSLVGRGLDNVSMLVYFPADFSLVIVSASMLPVTTTPLAF